MTLFEAMRVRQFRECLVLIAHKEGASWTESQFREAITILCGGPGESTFGVAVAADEGCETIQHWRYGRYLPRTPARRGEILRKIVAHISPEAMSDRVAFVPELSDAEAALRMKGADTSLSDALSREQDSRRSIHRVGIPG